MTSVPVPVVNEYEGVQSDVEKIARQLHAQHQDEPVWDKLHSNRQDDYYLSASRVLALPAVAAAFEAQAKLEALLGDLPAGWTRQYRVVWTDRITPSAAIESAWSDNPDFVEVVREKFKPERIERFEQSIRSPAVRVEEGGELS